MNRGTTEKDTLRNSEADSPPVVFSNQLKEFYGEDFIIPPNSDSEVDEYDSEVEGSVPKAKEANEPKVKKDRVLAKNDEN